MVEMIEQGRSTTEICLTQGERAVADNVASTESMSRESPNADRVIVSFASGDPEAPYNWSTSRKILIMAVASLTCVNSTMGSALTSNLISSLQVALNVPSGPQTILPSSLYLLGFVLGPLLFAPMSEAFGRKPILMIGFSGYILATLACALAPNWAAFLIFRFLAGCFASPPMSVVGGVIADVFPDKVWRGKMLMFWSAVMLVGPLTAPIIAGFTVSSGWRWTFWIALIIAGVSFIALITLPETFEAKILRKKAAKLNKESGSQKYICEADIDRGSLWNILITNLRRPIHLLFNELIISLTCIYMAFVYAVFYMLLVIFPTIFEGIYGFSAGYTGAAFTIMALGTAAACLTHLWFDGIATKIAARRPERYAEYLRLPLACAGGPAFVAALLWLGWTSRADIHWVVPLLSLVPYGFAYQMIFMAMANYVTDAYGIYAASALATLGTTRSLAGAVIPLAVNSMLSSLGVAWSCTTLALISVALSATPFGFIVWGAEIRKGSSFSRKVQEQSDQALMRTPSMV